LSEEEKKALRGRFAAPEQRLVLYTGNFQSYQGIDLFLSAAAKVSDSRVVFLLVGGSPGEVKLKRNMASDLGLGGRVNFTGQVPPSRVPHYIQIADVLVSPRTAGTNTPLKIYSFLKSGKPTVATDLWTHTQVLNPKIAVLEKPEPEKMAAAIAFACFAPEAGERAQRAAAMAAEKYSFNRYRDILAQVLKNAVC
jgi:glycosyltransferase involved in cell wall biosynthesis